MNVNQLADELEMWGRDLLALNMKGGIPVIEGAKMLRQQQAEIEALKKTISSLFGGLEASLDLNKAQALRKAQDK